MSVYGYARVSSLGEDLSFQESKLHAAGCHSVHFDQTSSSPQNARPSLEALLERMHRGDTLMVTRVERLATSISDLQDIVRQLTIKGVALKATEQPVNTRTAAGKGFVNALSILAEFESHLRRERQMQGIAAAKSRGVYKGRRPAIDREQVAALAQSGLSKTAIARRLGIGRASVYRILEEMRRNADTP